MCGSSPLMAYLADRGRCRHTSVVEFSPGPSDAPMVEHVLLLLLLLLVIMLLLLLLLLLILLLVPMLEELVGSCVPVWTEVFGKWGFRCEKKHGMMTERRKLWIMSEQNGALWRSIQTVKLDEALNLGLWIMS